MKRKIVLLLTTITLLGSNLLNAQPNSGKHDETIFIWGGDINLKFTQYVGDLTGKENPKICYLPTASGDHSDNIKYWENICGILKIDTIIVKVWGNMLETKPFEETLLNVDAIVVGGGNTLNMLGIWKAQGIDAILKKALQKGIILSGGSAGSICWFQNGISDSRPANYSIVDGLAFLPFSNCPHYSDPSRQNLYHQMIIEGKMKPGYATDELAGVLFKNGKAVDFINQSDKHNSYFVSKEKGKIKSEKFESKVLLMHNAIPENSYTVQTISKTVNNLLSANSNSSTPLNAYVSLMESLTLNKEGVSESEKENVKKITVEKVFVLNDKIAGVVHDAYIDFLGYGMWYFYNCNGVWTNAGEDIGGQTLFESEITFREKATTIIKDAENRSICH